MTTKSLILALSALLLFFTDCKKTCTSVNPALNITQNAAYVVNGGTGTLSVIDLTTDKKINDIELDCATFPHHIYLNPDKNLLAVAIIGADLSGGHAGHGSTASGFRIVIIDAVKGTVHHTITVDKSPHNAIFTPDGKELWVGQQEAGTANKILIFTTSDFSKTGEITVGKGLSEVTFSTDGTKAFATNTEENTVSVIKIAGKMVEKTISVGTTPVGAWAAANGKMYADSEGAKTVSEIDVATATLTETITLGFTPGYVAFNKSNNELWISDATNGKVVWYKKVNNLWAKQGDLATGTDAHAIVFNADGTKAYVTNQGAANVSIINTTTHLKIADIAVGTKPNGIVLKQ